MTCRELTQLITDYLDGRLGPWRWVSFQLHLGLCRDCRRYLRQMRLTVAALGAIPVDPPDAGTRDELLRRFRTWRS
ncbi:MAG TPA: zf-HC2 domain-containing protein [Polyangia bacterium]|jgi:anti-sigma factor RsiW